jgi:hypothetical protein
MRPFKKKNKNPHQPILFSQVIILEDIAVIYKSKNDIFSSLVFLRQKKLFSFVPFIFESLYTTQNLCVSSTLPAILSSPHLC